MTMPSEAVRAYIYRVFTAVGAILLVTGLVSDQVWPLVVALVATILGNGQAALNTSTKAK